MVHPWTLAVHPWTQIWSSADLPRAPRRSAQDHPLAQSGGGASDLMAGLELTPYGTHAHDVPQRSRRVRASRSGVRRLPITMLATPRTCGQRPAWNRFLEPRPAAHETPPRGQFTRETIAKHSRAKP